MQVCIVFAVGGASPGAPPLASLPDLLSREISYARSLSHAAGCGVMRPLTFLSDGNSISSAPSSAPKRSTMYCMKSAWKAGQRA